MGERSDRWTSTTRSLGPNVSGVTPGTDVTGRTCISTKASGIPLREDDHRRRARSCGPPFGSEPVTQAVARRDWAVSETVNQTRTG